MTIEERRENYTQHFPANVKAMTDNQVPNPPKIPTNEILYDNVRKASNELLISWLRDNDNNVSNNAREVILGEIEGRFHAYQLLDKNAQANKNATSSTYHGSLDDLKDYVDERLHQLRAVYAKLDNLQQQIEDISKEYRAHTNYDIHMTTVLAGIKDAIEYYNQR